MPPTDPASSGAAWQHDLMALLAEINAASTPDAEAQVLTRLTSMDEGFQRFLVARMTEQGTAEAATFLAALASHPGTPPAVRADARAGLEPLAEQGILPAATGHEEFYTGWVQQGRERGEQIMLLGWRLPDERLDACVFLLDWRGDGLKDFYRTRDLTPEEWRELVEHNGKKGAPLVEISLAEGRALLEDALAEGKRFSRPVPREYKLSQGLMQTRVFDATQPAATMPTFVNPGLRAEEVVRAYVAALHFRDYALQYALLAREHAARTQGTQAEAVESLRQEQKHAPRRREEVHTSAPTAAANVRVMQVEVEGEEETVERTGRRTRQSVREWYSLVRTDAGWRIAAVKRE